MLLSVARPPQLERLFAKLFDEAEFLSPHGFRAVSAYHRDHPYQFDAEGFQASIDYEPAESTTSMFGGNSNWRGRSGCRSTTSSWSHSSGTTGSTASTFDETGAETQAQVQDNDADVWHVFGPGVGAGQAYGYRVSGPWDPAAAAS
jgi:Carbohydrate-binding module 48 (Isoamylase N-terminal domain)